MYFKKFIILLGLAASQAQAEESVPYTSPTSSVTLPISIDLAVVQERANDALPGRLANIKENNKLCVPAKRAKYEYPCFRGLKIYSCDGWTKVSPDIYCDINGHVNKRGNLDISGTGETITVSLPIHASVSAKAGVSETAKADATFFVSAKPDLSENWELLLSLSSDFRWDKRPTLKLFNFIPVTIGSKVEPKLREKMSEMETKIQDEVAKMDVRAKVESAWLKLQQPIQFSTNPEVWAMFRPSAVGYSGITVSNKRLDTNVMISGDARVSVGPKPSVAPVELLPLQRSGFGEGGFNLAIPTIVEVTEILESYRRKTG